MNTGKNRVKGLKTELFKKKYQTDPLVKNLTNELNMSGNQLVVNSTPEPNIQRPRSVYDESFYQIPEYNQLSEADKTSKSDELTKNMTPLDLNQTSASTQEEPKTDWRDYVRTGTGIVSATKGIYDDVQTRQDNNQRIQNLNDRPRYMPNEYEYMARPGSQSTIYAKHGAEIRTGTQSGAEEAELERGEMFMMPNMDTYIVGGKKHSQGGEDFVLPEGTIVFSDHLKVPGLGKTFSTEAKKYDVTKYKKILDNPHSKAVDRTTAEVLLNRNMKKLQELFQIQQAMNGDSNGEMEPEAIRKGQNGLRSGSQPPMALNPQQQKIYNINQGIFNDSQYNQQMVNLRDFGPLYSNWKEENLSNKVDEAEAETQRQRNMLNALEADGTDPMLETMPNKSSSQGPASPANYVKSDGSGKTFLNDLDEIISTKEAASVNPNGTSLLGSTPQVTPNTAANIVGATQADPTTAGTVGKTNATDDNSINYKTLPNGRRVFLEDQGDYKGKSKREQYGGDIFKLVSNRLNENYDQLNPLLLSAYQMQLKDKKLMVGNSEDLVDIMKSGNNTLVSMRNFYKGINKEDMLFDPALDRGADDNMKQAKTAQLFKDYVESPQYLADLNADPPKVSTYIPWLKNQPKPVKDAKGNITKYTLESAEMSPEFTEKYQAAYRAFGGVKGAQSKLGKDKDMLRGFRIAPEGLSDHQWMGLPISPVDVWGGNTTIGQISAFEDEEPVYTKPGEKPKKKGDPGKVYDTKVGPVPKGEYIKAPFDYPQLAPELYGMAASQMYAYTPMDYNAPYVMPQTLNIQPQLQDIDSSYMAAMNAGGDPNAALIATLGAKQKLYSEKQNFDAQQRAQVDQVNAQARWQEDVYDMQSLDRVYNTLIAQADDAVTAQRQALVKSATDKRSIYNLEENKKKLYIDNFVRNYKVDGKTGSMTLNVPQGYDPFKLAESYYEASKTEAARRAAEASASTTTKSSK